MKRKKFIQQFGATALIASLGITLDSCTYEILEDSPTPLDEDEHSSNDLPPIPANSISIDLNSDPFSILQAEEGWLLYTEEQMLLVNIAGVISAFSSECPHAGCREDWEVENQQFVCTCHFSRFELDGTLVGGPADTDLAKLTAVRRGDTLFVG